MDIVIKLIIVNIFGTTVQISRIKKVNEPFVFTIMTKGYFCRTLKNQLQNNITRYSFKMSKIDTIFFDTIGYNNQCIYKIL